MRAFDFDEGKDGAVIADPVNLALGSGIGEIAREDIAVTAQMPIRVGFAARARAPGALFDVRFTICVRARS